MHTIVKRSGVSYCQDWRIRKLFIFVIHVLYFWSSVIHVRFCKTRYIFHDLISNALTYLNMTATEAFEERSRADWMRAALTPTSGGQINIVVGGWEGDWKFCNLIHRISLSSDYQRLLYGRCWLAVVYEWICDNLLNRCMDRNYRIRHCFAASWFNFQCCRLSPLY